MLLLVVGGVRGVAKDVFNKILMSQVDDQVAASCQKVGTPGNWKRSIIF